MASPKVQVRRIYDSAKPDDGVRVLVDRMWPRGLRKDAIDLDKWLKDVAPSGELRKWYGHEPARFDEFRRRYRDELDSDTGRAALDELASMVRGSTLTLLTATKDVAHSHATVLADVLAKDS